MHTGQEPLQPLEVNIAFRSDQFLSLFVPRMMPMLRDPSGVLGCIGYADLAKPCSLNESFVLSGRTVHVKADRATRGDFFVGKRSAHYQSVTEQHSSAGFQYPKHLTQHLGTPWNVAQNVIREHSIKGIVIKRQIFRSVTLLKKGL
jgi:hypothetical protein